MWKLGRIVLVCLVAAPVAAAETQSESVTAVLVRHAEKAAESGDPELTAAGRDRAVELARVVRDLGIDVVYSTPFQRTTQTAGPIAEQLALDPVILSVDGDHVADTAARLRGESPGSAALYVGHSNTVPEIASALGCADVPPIDDSEYDTLWIVSFVADGPPTCHHLRFGAAID